MKAKYTAIKIDSVVGVVPKSISYFDDELKNYSHDHESSMKLKKLMGYGEHRICIGNETTSDLAIFGVNTLVSSGALSLNEVGAVVFVSQTPDYILPSTSSVIHGKLGLSHDCYTLDINDGCCGFIRGIQQAASLITTTDIDCVLLVTGDVLSKKVSKRDRNSYPLIGDAATVTIIKKGAEADVIELEVMNDGAGCLTLQIPAGGARMPSSELTAIEVADEDGNWRSKDQLVMQGREVLVFTQTIVPDFLKKFFEQHGINPSDLDYLFLHQANAFIIDRIRKKFGLPTEKVPDTVVKKYGNSSSATIPMLLASTIRADLGAKFVACGFGIGLSWGALSAHVNNLKYCEVVEYEL